MTRIVIALACALAVAVSGGSAAAQSRCDADGDGRVTDVDLVNVLRDAAELSSSCTLATCDADEDGAITDLDGVQVLRAAADLPSACTAIVLSPANATITVGESRFYTAIGNFAGGDAFNLTQAVDYSSSNEAVAMAPNEPGLRSRVTAVGPGETTITARDPDTGVVSNGVRLTVLGALESITLTPESATRPIGTSIFYTAVGHFAGGATLNLTQAVDYSSSNEAVAVAPNVPGEKSRVDPVGMGETTISARDPETGVTSNEAMLTVVP